MSNTVYENVERGQLYDPLKIATKQKIGSPTYRYKEREKEVICVSRDEEKEPFARQPVILFASEIRGRGAFLKALRKMCGELPLNNEDSGKCKSYYLLKNN